MRDPESEISYLSRQGIRSSRGALSRWEVVSVPFLRPNINHQTLFESPDEEVACLGVSRHSLMAPGYGVSRVY